MGLAQTTKDDLKAEQGRLQEDIERFAEQTERLRKRYEAIAELLGDEPALAVPTDGFAEMGLRDAMRTVLKEAGILKPVQVTRILKARGFLNKGKTDLSVRVSNDLWKLAKVGQLQKNANGEYRLR